MWLAAGVAGAIALLPTFKALITELPTPNHSQIDLALAPDCHYEVQVNPQWGANLILPITPAAFRSRLVWAWQKPRPTKPAAWMNCSTKRVGPWTGHSNQGATLRWLSTARQRSVDRDITPAPPAGFNPPGRSDSSRELYWGERLIAVPVASGMEPITGLTV